MKEKIKNWPFLNVSPKEAFFIFKELSFFVRIKQRLKLETSQTT